MNDITYRPIGNIRTPFKKQAGMPIQPSGAKGVWGTIKINKDYIDGTPLLDIKPYVPEFDAQTEVKTGWLAEVKKQVKQVKSDNRFNSSKKV